MGYAIMIRTTKVTRTQTDENQHAAAVVLITQKFYFLRLYRPSVV